MLDSIFDSNSTYTANIQDYTQTITSGTLGVPSWSTSKSVSCLFWRGPMVSKFVNEQFKPDVSGIVLLRPSDISTTEIPSTGRIQIMDGGTQIGIYKIIYADDIAQQNQVIIVPVKEFT